ncbi:hypothetical protein GCM10022243_30860 [Saccharothrix violaceirubra]|uniref:P/Homo B domain-containing protein n=1 Tax=Saccharothrix violaceirubra TaxID=413306 RepID=A0A7W7T545_9PSEU|nr:hypothetical protein [Saccharothrix violaceirubra]MBB4966711.1 hypothetical protein [Saccharothrix violaceirubra]
MERGILRAERDGVRGMVLLFRADDACHYSPRALPEAVTVGNLKRDDQRSSSSDYGTCLDIWAPGESIVSASHSDDSGSATMTGTWKLRVRDAAAKDTGMIDSRSLML